MLLQFAEKTISGILVAVLCVALITAFGQEFIFDPLILSAFLGIAFLFRRNKDLVFICAIFIIERGVEEIVWRLLQNTLWFKVPGYLLFIAISYWCAKGALRLYAMSFFTLSFAIEGYWYLTDYHRIPFTLLACYMVCASLVVRYALRRRVFWHIAMFGKMGTPVNFDFQLLRANAGFILLHSAATIEFYIREFFAINLAYVYNANVYVCQTLSLFIIYMLIIESISHLKNRELHA